MTERRVLAGRYELVAPLDRGAMGEVWEARHTLTDRPIAVKLLLAADREDLRDRMMREARAAGRIVHPNVVHVLDVGTQEDGAPFLVMERLVGRSLDDVLEQGGPLPTSRAAGIARDAAKGLAAAHAAGVVHRDLKPANVFLHQEAGAEVVKVVDFGVSKTAEEGAYRTATGQAVGSPAYMSPEQARGDKDIGTRSDLWALGVLVYRMCTGRIPFAGESTFEVVAEILKSPIPRLSDTLPAVDPRLDDLVFRCLQRDPAVRLASADEAVRVLDAVARGVSIADAPPLATADPAGPPPSHAEATIPTASRARSSSGESFATTALAPVGHATDPRPPPPRSKTLLWVALAATVGAAGAYGLTRPPTVTPPAPSVAPAPASSGVVAEASSSAPEPASTKPAPPPPPASSSSAPATTKPPRVEPRARPVPTRCFVGKTEVPC